MLTLFITLSLMLSPASCATANRIQVAGPLEELNTSGWVRPPTPGAPQAGLIVSA